MPKICYLKEIDGAMWVRLDIDWDGGSVSLYTPTEVQAIRDNERKRIIHTITNLDRISYYED